jgi:hypothetical protein
MQNLTQKVRSGQTIKNPILANEVLGLTEFLTSKEKNTSNNYTISFKNCNTKYYRCKTLVLLSLTVVKQIAKSGKNKYYNLQNQVNKTIENIANNNFVSIIGIITSSSGMNRTRQQAVFLRPLYFAFFRSQNFIIGLCYKLKTVYGGLRKGNINNTFRRLDAVIETCHPIKVVVLLNHLGA